MPSPSGRRWALLAAFAAGCPSSPGHLEPPVESTAIRVGAYALAPRSTFTFSADYTMAMVTDHASACAEMSTLNACKPESWLAKRRYIDSPISVRTALVIHLADPKRPTQPGTYPVSKACGGGAGPYAYAAFLVRDASGQLIVRDEVASGTVLLWEIAPGEGASGTYDLVFESGAAVGGAFSGAPCGQVAPFASAPLASVDYQPGSAVESCTCAGATALSTCTQTSGNPWTCQCTNADSTTSSCTLPADASFPVCGERYFTCCPMCP